ncbi:FtsK/SpoIIIE domain-containing protein [Enterococcus innesii]|uniref:FtsK/SpoIIIE domain-containing protein n=1 Tax=Enterococcus innesii TaxID=2839759 RepID=UPI003D0B2D55
MKTTSRMKRGILASVLFLLLMVMWFLFRFKYPSLQKEIKFIQLPIIPTDVFFYAAMLTLALLALCWLIRNKIWYGLGHAFDHYLMTKQLRKQLLIAGYEENKINEDIGLTLPEIHIKFDDKKARLTGRIKIKNSVKLDKLLEKIRLDSALPNYLIDRQYLSRDRNWYIFEFYATDVLKQSEFKTKRSYIDWSNENTDNYSLRIDERTIVPIHMMGVAGVTGSGKSMAIQALCEQIMTKSINHELFVIDPKMADLYYFGKSVLSPFHVASKDGAILLLREFEKRMVERQKELEPFFFANKNQDYTKANLPALILLIDEFGALHESWKLLPKKDRDEIDALLANIAFMGRQIGCFLWISTQQMNAQTVPTAIRDQLVIKMTLGNSDEQTYRTLFASGVQIPKIDFKPGQGVISSPSVATVEHPRLLNIPYCSFLKT